MMVRRTIALAVSITVMSSLGPGVNAQSAASAEQSRTPPPSYVLKANSKWANQIDDALAKVAQKVQFLVPSRFTPQAFVESLCAGVVEAAKLEITDSKQQPGRFEVKMPPCLQVRRNVKVPVGAGDTLEGLAVVSGLPAANAESYKVITAEDATPRNIKPGSLKAGDTVVFPEVPVWTDVVANPEVAADRDALVKAIAGQLPCRSADAEACLRQNGIELLNRATVPPKPTVPAKPIAVPKGFESQISRPTPAPRFEGVPLSNAAPPQNAEVRGVSASPVRPESITVAESSAAAPIAAPAPPPPPPAPMAPVITVAAPSTAVTAVVASDTHDAEPPPNATFSVHPDQWPYDVELLAKILEDVGPTLLPTIIGIADGGLADRRGGPLAATAYSATIEKKFDPEFENEDDDGNRFVDDLLGAGVNRPGVMQISGSGSGNVSLCEASQPNFTNWPRVASHGTAVSAIASARRVREKNNKLAAFLPQLIFFRLVGEACDSQANFGIGDGDMRKGFDYLMAQHADIINISYRLDKQVGDSLTPRLKEVLPLKGTLLFLPAGNGETGDLDKKPPVCPACIGNPEHGRDASRRAVVVGAATRDLHRPDFSNYGERTVGLFAPGDPADAIDLMGQPLSADEGATSYATPYASLAAALIRSFGKPNDYGDIRDRLDAATWPLDDSKSNTAKTYVGVVDLVKAAAVRHHAVEVKEQLTDGTWVRKTYVGTLSQPLKELEFCQGHPFTENSYHAVRIGEPGPNGRTVRLYPRAVDDETHTRVPRDFSTQCKPAGTLKMKTINGTDVKFPLSRVTYVQTKWF